MEWPGTTLEQRDLAAVQLEGANLYGTHLEGACLARVNLNNAFAFEVHLESADLFEAHLEGANLTRGYLCGASLRRAFFNGASILYRVSLGNADEGFARLAGAQWGNADLSTISWTGLHLLGDEIIARSKLDFNGKVKTFDQRIDHYGYAVRAYRQIAIALRSQGMNEVADKFAYRAQLCQRRLFRFGGLSAFTSYLGSLLLDLSSGYGYRPGRSLGTYAIVIGVFGLIYALLLTTAERTKMV